jgi:hypothetical protein
MRSSQTFPWYLYVTLGNPARVAENLNRVLSTVDVGARPNLWQLSLGVMRMWQRLLFRGDTVGLCQDHPVRDNWRARLFLYRPLRFPFLWREKAVAPLDYTGLISPPERLVSHLVGTHHDGAQFVYDFELLKGHPGMLDELRRQTLRILEKDDARSRWLKDLCVYENYHENLLAALDDFRAGHYQVEAQDDPDITLPAFLRWCAAQPTDPKKSWHTWRQQRAAA